MRFRAIEPRVDSLLSFTAALLAVASCSLGGCGGAAQDLPATCEVTGTVLDAGGKPLIGGWIEFRSTAGTPVSATGKIEADGTFSLSTMVHETKLPGAVAGTHQVTVLPPPPATQSVQPVALPVTVPERFDVKPGGANRFTVKLPKQ